MRQAWPNVTGFEDGEWGHELRTQGNLQKLKKDTDIYSPLETPEGTWPCQPFDFSAVTQRRLYIAEKWQKPVQKVNQNML